MAKARPKPRILFVCSQNTEGFVDPGAIEVLKQLLQLLAPLQEQGQVELWVEEPDSSVYLEDILYQRPARQYMTIVHVLGPLVNGMIKVMAREKDGYVSCTDEIWQREEWPFLRSVIFSGSQPVEWQKELIERGIPMVLDTGINLESAIEPYLHLMAGIPVLEAATAFIDHDEAVFPYKGEGFRGSWFKSAPRSTSRSVAYLENKARALSWRLRNPLLIPSAEKQWLNKQILTSHTTLPKGFSQTSDENKRSSTAELSGRAGPVGKSDNYIVKEDRREEVTEPQQPDSESILSNQVNVPDTVDIVPQDLYPPDQNETDGNKEKEQRPQQQLLTQEDRGEQAQENQSVSEKNIENIDQPQEEQDQTNPTVDRISDPDEEGAKEQAGTIALSESLDSSDDSSQQESENGATEIEGIDFYQLSPLFPQPRHNKEPEQESVNRLDEVQQKSEGITEPKVESRKRKSDSSEREQSDHPTTDLPAELVSPPTATIPVRTPRPARRPKKYKQDSPDAYSAKKSEETPDRSPRKPKPARRDPGSFRQTTPENFKPSRPAEPVPQAKRKRKILLVGLLLLAGITSAGILFPEIYSSMGFGSSRPENPCPFPNEDENFHVLVLSFIQTAECAPSKLIHEEVLLRQMKKLRQEGIHLDVRLLEVEDCEGRKEKAKGIAESCGADLVIWGTYQDNAGSSGKGELAYYLTDQKYIGLISSEGVVIEEVSFQPDTIIGESTLLFGINLLYWYEAQLQRELGSPLEVVRYLEFMEPLQKKGERVRISFLTNAYLSVGLFEKARQMYNQLIAATPTEKKNYLERAEILRRMGLYELAADDFRKVTEIDPDNLEALIGRGIVYTESGSYRKAINDFNSLISGTPDLALGYLHRGNAYAASGNPWRALNDYNRAIDTNPQYVEAFLARAEVQFSLKKDTDALNDIQEALRLNPDLEEAKLLRVSRMVEQGQYDQALEELARLIEATPTAETYKIHARLMLEIKDPHRAIQSLTTAINLNPADYESFFQRGLTFFALSDLINARNDFEQVARLRPLHTESMAWMGRTFSLSGDTDSARLWFEKALAVDPQLAEPVIYLAEMKYRAGEYDRALQDMNQLIARISRRADAYLLRGRIHVARGSIFAGLEDFNRAIRTDESLSGAYLERSKVKISINNMNGAAADLDQAILLKTTDPEAYLIRANLHLDVNEFEPVSGLFAQVLNLDSTYVPVYLARGQYFLRFKQYQQAYDDIHRAIQLSPSISPDVYLIRGNILAALGSNNEAMLDFNRVIRFWPDSARVYCARGMLYQSMGQLNQAQEDFGRAMEIDPQDPQTFFSQGLLYFEMDNTEQALEYFDQAIQTDRTFADAYTLRGEVLVSLEAFEKALEDFTEALNLDQTNSRAYRNRANLARKVSEYESAISDYSQAILYDPSDSESYYNRGFIYAMQERYDLAVSDIRKSLELDPEDGLRYGNLAKIYARQGKEELFYQNIDIALSKKYPMIELDHDPAFSRYRNEERFQNLLNRYTR